MKGYSKAASHKGKTAYRTPSRWLAGKPEAFKQNSAHTKLSRKDKRFFSAKGGSAFGGKKPF